MQEVLNDLERANSRKHINETFMNQRSSRSHTIMTFNVKVMTKVMIDGQKNNKNGKNCKDYNRLKKCESNKCSWNKKKSKCS